MDVGQEKKKKKERKAQKKGGGKLPKKGKRLQEKLNVREEKKRRGALRGIESFKERKKRSPRELSSEKSKRGKDGKKQSQKEPPQIAEKGDRPRGVGGGTWEIGRKKGGGVGTTKRIQQKEVSSK